MLQVPQESLKPCLECDGLKNGMRPNQDSHEYMIAAPGGSSYRCLLCGTVLTRLREELGTRWH